MGGHFLAVLFGGLAFQQLAFDGDALGFEGVLQHVGGQQCRVDDRAGPVGAVRVGGDGTGQADGVLVVVAVDRDRGAASGGPGGDLVVDGHVVGLGDRGDLGRFALARTGVHEDADGPGLVVVAGGHGQRRGLVGVAVLQVVPAVLGAQAPVVERGVVGDEVAFDLLDAEVGDLGGHGLEVGLEEGRVAAAAQEQVAFDGSAVDRSVGDGLGGEGVILAEDLQRPRGGGEFDVGAGVGAGVAIVVVDDLAGFGVGDDYARLGVGESGVGEDRVERVGQSLVAGFLCLRDDGSGDADRARGRDGDRA
ncbi:hypothetical protein GCM10029992_16510 [Glycomyces albus]